MCQRRKERLGMRGDDVWLLFGNFGHHLGAVTGKASVLAPETMDDLRQELWLGQTALCRLDGAILCARPGLRGEPVDDAHAPSADG
jgi:hypothetical protein